MNSKVFFLLTLLVLFTSSIAFAQTTDTEEITLSTYYPAPYGEYDELFSEKLLVWRPDAAEMADMSEGDCHIGWSLIVGTGGTGFSYDELAPLDLPGDGDVLIKGNVGIGTTTPSEKLQIVDSGAIKVGYEGYFSGTQYNNWQTVLGQNLVTTGTPGDPDNYITPLTTSANYGYRGIIMRFNTGIHFVGSSDATTAAAEITPNYLMSIYDNGNIGIGTTGDFNIFLGYGAGYLNTTGELNTFIGLDAGRSNTTGGYNTFIGREAGYSNTTGSDSMFIGLDAGYANTTGFNNTFIGYRAGVANTTGEKNTFLSYRAGHSNTTGSKNTFVGYKAGYSNTDGNENTFLGRYAGHNNVSGDSNVFLGYEAGYYETGSDKLYIDNQDVTSPLIYGDFSANTVSINGALSKSSGTFLIDHPVEPENMILRHSFIEGPEPVLIYKGRSKLVDGEAAIKLPGYFDALNHPQGREISLTCIGGWSPLYLETEISGNSFIIKTTPEGNPGQEFSWVVYGVRNDAFIQKNPIIVEEEKGAGNRFNKGEYLNPEVFGVNTTKKEE